MQTVGIIGTGMAGMAAAYRLKDRFRLTFLEKEKRLGGHTHTVQTKAKDESVPVDTGFMVFNRVTYPEMIRLFEDLKVPIMPTDMSFGLSHREMGLEYSGSSLNGLFAQRKNIISPRYWRILLDIVRFNKAANAALKDDTLGDESLEEFVLKQRLSPTFRDAYLVPMTSAIWSTPPDRMLRFPALSLLRFMYNHGLLGVTTQHQWFTVKGGSREYQKRLLSAISAETKTNFAVSSVTKKDHQVEVRDQDGNVLQFDHVIIAAHADQALGMLTTPTAEEVKLLSPFQYANNPIVLHSDPAVMPEKKNAWAAWNYRLEQADGKPSASTHYWMNRLQGVSERRGYFVSVNYSGSIDPEKVYFETTYTHPMFDQFTALAQKNLPNLNQSGPIYFCGSYFRYGFHEDALISGFAAADALLHQFSTHDQLAV